MGLFGIELDMLFVYVASYRYLALLIGAIIEGPIITILGGFFTYLGKLKIYYVYPVLVLGDILGDTIAYFIGYVGRRNFLVKILKYLQIKEEKLLGLDNFFIKHGGKSIFFSKFIAGAGSWTLISAGVSKMKLKKFYKYSISATLIKAIIYIAIGYFFGSMYKIINKWLNIGSTIVVLLIIATILILIFRKVSKPYFKKIKKKFFLKIRKKKKK